MKVSVSSIGRFHAFDLARQLDGDGHLERLYTAYPIWKVDPDLRPRTASFPWLSAPYMLAERLGFHRVRDWLRWPLIESYDHWVASRLTGCDVVVALSSFGLHTFRTARERGILTVCDRGSTHIAYQDRLLAEEYERYGLPYEPIDERVVRKELAEYAIADLITVPSTVAYTSFVAEGIPASKLERVSYGVDLSLFRPVEKQDDVFRVLYVGALSVQKGIRDLLEAFRGLSLPNFELVIAGGMTPEVQPLLAQYEGQFRYLGFLPRAELAQVYSQASVFVISSIQEGLALVQAQAMACGLPVVATTNTGAADLFTDGVEGFIVPIRSPEAIRDRVLYLYDHPEVRQQMSRAALARVTQMGGWDGYGHRAVAVYQERHRRRAGAREGQP